MQYFIEYISSDLIALLRRSDLKLTIIITFLVWFLIKQIKYYSKLPPGPWGVPLLGYLPFMSGTAPHLWYMAKADQYGDIFSLKMGNNLIVCIGSVNLLKDLFYRLDSTGRPHTPLHELLGGYGIVTSEGTLWKKQRQFLHEKFRNLGVKLWPNQRFENYIIMEVKELLQILDRSKGRAVDPSQVVGRHIHNVICQLMMSFRFEENDKEFDIFNHNVNRGMKLFGSVLIGEHIRHYTKLPGKQAVLREIKKNLQDVSKFHYDRLKERIERRKRTKETYEPSDLLDHYVEQIEREEQNNEISTIFPRTDQVSQIVQVMNDLFSAGMETSRTSLLWCFIMMLREKEVAKKVRNELLTVVHVGDLVTLEHRSSLPYTEAVIFETLRLVSVVPLGTTHVNTSPWTIGQYTIPAGTHVIPLINKMNMDPELYPEPYAFKPERFIRDGQFKVCEKFMQFGIGQRMCLGTQLARMELFLFFANIMNNFEMAMPEGHEVPSLQGVLAVTHMPLPFSLCFKNLQH